MFYERVGLGRLTSTSCRQVVGSADPLTTHQNNICNGNGNHVTKSSPNRSVMLKMNCKSEEAYDLPHLAAYMCVESIRLCSKIKTNIELVFPQGGNSSVLDPWGMCK